MNQSTRGRKTLPSGEEASNAKATRRVRPGATAVRAELPEAPESRTPKQKLVRDSFTIPKLEYVVLQALKERATVLQRPTKKSELLRAGIATLAAMSDKAFLAAIRKVPSLAPGRPKRESPDSA